MGTAKRLNFKESERTKEFSFHVKYL